MRKEILDALKAKFEGVSESILGRIAEKLARTAKDAEEVKTAVDGITIQQVVEAYADSRATEAQQTAVANYEKKFSLKDGKKVEVPKEDPQGKTVPEGAGGAEDVPEWAKALMASSEAMKSELLALKAEKAASGRKAALGKALEKAPEQLRSRYERDFERMSFKDEDDFNAWVGGIDKDLEGIAEGYRGGKAVVTRTKGTTGGGSGEPEKVDPYLVERLKSQEAETVAPAIIGLPN